MALQNRGIVKTAQFKAALLPVPIPKVTYGNILVRTITVALNPTDWQTRDEEMGPNAKPMLLGVDAAGIVVEVGPGVTKDYKNGDRIAGMSHGGNERNPETGTFAEYILIRGDISLKIPPNISFEEAATLGCALATVSLGFYRYLEMPFLSFPPEPKPDGPPILIYGGSSATGTIAIQFAKLSGFTVITVASPRNFELCKRVGADHVFDYRDPDCGSKIRTLTSNNLSHVFDTIAKPSSVAICEAAMSIFGGNYVTLLPVEVSRSDLKNAFFLGYTAGGEEFEMSGEVHPAVPEDFELTVRFFALADKLLEKGMLKAHPHGLRGGGLEGIFGGLDESKEGKVSGEKLVYRIADP